MIILVIVKTVISEDKILISKLITDSQINKKINITFTCMFLYSFYFKNVDKSKKTKAQTQETPR